MRLSPALAVVALAATTVLTPTAAEASWGCDIPVVSVGTMPNVTVHAGAGRGAGVCVYAGLYTSLLYETGYRIGIENVAAIPVIDSYTEACPTSDDVLAGAVADPSNPLVYTPYRVAVTNYGSEVGVCVVARGVRTRLVFTSDGGTPSVVFDNRGGGGDFPSTQPGTASRACQDNGNIPITAAVGPVGSMVGWALAPGNVVYLCVRVGNVGGRLRIDGDGNAGPILWWTPSSSCTTTWWTTSAPVATSVRTGPVNVNGATPVCTSVAGFEVNYLVYGNYRPGTPTVDWVADA